MATTSLPTALFITYLWASYGKYVFHFHRDHTGTEHTRPPGDREAHGSAVLGYDRFP